MPPPSSMMLAIHKHHLTVLWCKCVYWNGSHSSRIRCFSVLLPPEGASFCQSCFPACRLTEDSGAADTQDYRLCMAEDRGDFIASWALHIHKVGIGALHQALFLVFPLFLLWRGMKEILCERHVLVGRSSPPERQALTFK